MPTGSRPRDAGFAYVLLLVLVAVLGISAAGSVQLGQSILRRHAEEALLVAGEDFRKALASWRAAGAQQPAAAAGPTELAELLRDPRVPGVRRHLRRVPADPLTGSADWAVVRDLAGRIVAVHSLAPGRPIKREGFGPAQAGFTEAESYAQWQFGTPPVRVRAPGEADGLRRK
jgi:type II secretory pathway pseudopilin PulG